MRSVKFNVCPLDLRYFVVYIRTNAKVCSALDELKEEGVLHARSVAARRGTEQIRMDRQIDENSLLFRTCLATLSERSEVDRLIQ